MLSPKGSEGACLPMVFRHSFTPLHGAHDRRYRRVASVSCSSAEGEHTAVVDQGLRVTAALARVKYGMGVVLQIWA